MKRTIQIISILAAAISASSMTACGKKNDSAEKQEEKPKIVSSYENVDYENNVCFDVQENGRLDFLDLGTLEESPACDAPSCKHREGSDSTAYGKSNHPFISGKKLHYLKGTDMDAKKEYTSDTIMYSADVNGANEKQVAEIDGLSCNDYDRMAVCGGKAYIVMTRQPYDDDFKELEPSMELVAVTLDDGKVEKLGEVVKGYSCGTWVYGVWDGKLIFRTSKAADNRPFMERLQDFAEKNGLTESEALEQYTDAAEYKYENLALDIDSGKIESNPLPEPAAISEKYYYYLKDGKVVCIGKDGGEEEIGGAENVTNVTPINGYALIDSEGGEYLYDEDGKKLAKLKESYDIAAIADRYAVVRSENGDGYEKMEVSEMEAK